MRSKWLSLHVVAVIRAKVPGGGIPIRIERRILEHHQQEFGLIFVRHFGRVAKDICQSFVDDAIWSVFAGFYSRSVRDGFE